MAGITLASSSKIRSRALANTYGLVETPIWVTLTTMRRRVLEYTSGLTGLVTEASGSSTRRMALESTLILTTPITLDSTATISQMDSVSTCGQMETFIRENGRRELALVWATSNGLRMEPTILATSGVTLSRGREHFTMKIHLTIRESLPGTNEKALANVSGLTA
jgi:hypothetical protein